MFFNQNLLFKGGGLYKVYKVFSFPKLLTLFSV